MIGRVLGGYRVVERIGEGPNGVVWKAEHEELKSVVAIKVLPAELASKASDRERFERGSRAAARLHHAGIATVFAAEFAGTAPYIVSEYVDGETVNARTARGPVRPREAVEWALQAARALQYAHGQGVIHRDISGGNVMVTREGQCKLVDFGIAVERDATRKTTQGTVLGTWAYMAPEALRDETVSESRDTYALGAVLYQLLTGRVPFAAETFEGLVYRILNEDARPPSVHVAGIPAALDRVVLRALEKRPKLRMTMGRLIGELEAVLVSGALESGGERKVRGGWGSRADEAVGRWVRRVTTMAPSQVRRVMVVTSVTVVSMGTLGWLVARALPQGPVRPKVGSLAILPLFNESRETGFEYIGHGLAEHVAERVGGLKGLLVQPYRKWITGDAVELCGQLKVEGVLEGAFAVNGGEVETRVDLVKADGKREEIARTKSDGYKRAAEELAAQVAKGLKRRLTAEELAQVTVPAAGSNEAFDALSKGVDAHQRGDRDEALRWYERAVSLDPGLAKAYVGMGAIYYNRFYRGEAAAASLELANQYFRQALALDPDEGSAIHGLILVHSELAERESLLVIAQHAAHSSVGFDALMIPGWAYFLSAPDCAIPLLKRVLDQDPVNDEALWVLVIASTWVGHFEEAVRDGEDYLRRFGEDTEIREWLAIAHWRLGHTSAAATQFERLLSSDGVYAGGQALPAAWFYLKTGDTRKAKEIWTRVIEAGDNALGAQDNMRMRASRLEAYLMLGRVAEGKRELAQIDTLVAQNRLPGDVSLLWTDAAAVSSSSVREQWVGVIQRHFGPRHDLWEAAQRSKVMGGLGIDDVPELAPLGHAGLAYGDSLRVRFGLAPRPRPL